jgi:nicotinamidase-related amidase
MPGKNEDLHGNAPDKSDIALLLIDVINDMNFEGGEQLLKHALPMAEKIVVLKATARQRDIPTIYVNDNFGKWRSDFKQTLKHCLRTECPGKPVAELLQPDDDDYFVLKPKHSGFFSTTLDTLLEYLQVKTLVLTGIAGNNCVLFTANDAYMRDFNLVVPADCVASIGMEENEYALKQMEKVLKADITPSTELNFDRLKTEPKKPGQATR